MKQIDKENATYRTQQEAMCTQNTNKNKVAMDFSRKREYEHAISRTLVRLAAFQNVNCFVFEQIIVFHNAAIENTYNVFYFKTSSKSNQALDL